MLGLQTMFVGLQPGGHYTGVVSLGGSKHRIAVYDFNCNGLFNDYFRVRSKVVSSGGRFHPTGDQVLIDVNGDGRFEARRPDDRELYPHARYVEVNGKWYSLSFAPYGGKVDVQTPELKLGTIKVPAQSGSCAIQLLSENGIVTFHETGREFQVPAGTYQLYAHTTQAKHSSENWRYEAWGKTSGEKLQVAEGTVLPLRFGQPLLVDVTYRTQGRQGNPPKAGDTISLSLSFSGQGGEEYTDIWKEGLGQPAPTYRMVNEAGKTVAEGTFRHD
jgi:hypothetical protein